ncbi:MAG: NDP-sugar synthase [Candidatus Saliniplasma sp.]
MKAVILSGGFGTRMRPLTDTTPKPLLPILNKPLIRHVIDQLPDEIDEVILAANYKIDMLREYFEGEDIDKKIHVVDEPKPLGTGGAVKNIEEYLDDTFFVINSDIISSIDLNEYLDFFRSKDGVGAISAWEVEHPEEFGIFELNDHDRILRFQEKPESWEAFSNTINAGHYILEPEVLDLIPSGEKVSMEDEIFPLLVDDGLFGFEFDGYWVDCGRPSSFFEATRVLLEEMDKRYLIGDRSVIDGEIENYSVMGIDCTIGDSKISNSILFDGVEIDDGCIIENSIIGYDVIIEDDVKVKDSIISDNIYLEEGHEIIDTKMKSEGVE